MHHLAILTDNFIRIFRDLHKGKCLDEFLPLAIDYRCNLLGYHLFLWNIFAIVAPERIKLDLFNLLCSKGGLIFNSFVSPEGELHKQKFYQIWMDGRAYFYRDKPHNVKIRELLRRIMAFYRGDCLSDRRHKDDIGVRDFLKVWRQAAPEPYSRDEELGEKIGTLCKFHMATYNILRITDPFPS